MSQQVRYYRVGGLAFGVELEEPWAFMRYTPAVAERISLAASGGLVPILPTRAGDKVPARTYIQSRAELPEGYEPTMLDFSQYEPFGCPEPKEEIFRVTVCAGEPSWLVEAKAEGRFKHMMSVEDEMPCIYIYDLEGSTVFELDADRGHVVATVVVAPDTHSAKVYPKEGLKGQQLMFHVNTALMMLYTYNSAKYSALLMHASVVEVGGRASLFLGTSGTGKSTHSRLWLGNVEGARLVNDDNPVIRIEDGQLYVYGSPWSGKTPCYRNVRFPVAGIVRLTQAPENAISPLKGLEAYAALISSASSIRWNRPIMDSITSSGSNIAMSVPCWSLRCLPDAAAARLCSSTVLAK